MTKRQFDKKFVLQIGKRVIIGIYKEAVMVYKTRIVINKDEDEI